MPDRNRQILLVETPKGKLGPEHFRLAEAPLPTPQEGEVLARVRYISLDAANRAWMQGATYRSAVEAGSVMAGGARAEIVASKSPALRPGDLVFADTGWQDYAVLPAKRAAKLPRLEPLTGKPVHITRCYDERSWGARRGIQERTNVDSCTSANGPFAKNELGERWSDFGLITDAHRASEALRCLTLSGR